MLTKRVIKIQTLARRQQGQIIKTFSKQLRQTDGDCCLNSVESLQLTSIKWT